MHRTIREDDVAMTVRDFEVFCSYATMNELALTPKGALGKQACFDLNSRLRHPVPDAKNTHQMKKYPSIAMYLTIALRTGLLCLSPGAKKKAVLAATEYYTAFRQMNMYSKYLFLFLAWMRHIDTDEIYAGAMGLSAFDNEIVDYVFEVMETTAPQTNILREESYLSIFAAHEKSMQRLMDVALPLLQNFLDLGLVGHNGVDLAKPDIYEYALSKLWFTELGAALAAACAARRFSWINRRSMSDSFFPEDDDPDEWESDFAQNPPGTPGFFAPFAACFPKNAIDADKISRLLFPQAEAVEEGLIYEFRVSLARDCYRIIRCDATHTFEDFHLAIQAAFNFDDDHLYAFHMDGKRRSRDEINSPFCDEPPYADDVLIGEAGMRVKQKILYIFDFGDYWMFTITLLSAAWGDALPSPVIAKSVGSAPEQYPSDDDDDDDDDDAW